MRQRFSIARLRELWEERGYDLPSFAAAIDMSYATVKGWEYGNFMPTTRALCRIAAVLDVPVGALFVNVPEHDRAAAA